MWVQPNQTYWRDHAEYINTNSTPVAVPNGTELQFNYPVALAGTLTSACSVLCIPGVPALIVAGVLKQPIAVVTRGALGFAMGLVAETRDVQAQAAKGGAMLTSGAVSFAMDKAKVRLRLTHDVADGGITRIDLAWLHVIETITGGLPVFSGTMFNAFTTSLMGVYLSGEEAFNAYGNKTFFDIALPGFTSSTLGTLATNTCGLVVMATLPQFADSEQAFLVCGAARIGGRSLGRWGFANASLPRPERNAREALNILYDAGTYALQDNWTRSTVRKDWFGKMVKNAQRFQGFGMQPRPDDGP